MERLFKQPKFIIEYNMIGSLMSESSMNIYHCFQELEKDIDLDCPKNQENAYQALKFFSEEYDGSTPIKIFIEKNDSSIMPTITFVDEDSKDIAIKIAQLSAFLFAFRKEKISTLFPALQFVCKQDEMNFKNPDWIKQVSNDFYMMGIPIASMQK